MTTDLSHSTLLYLERWRNGSERALEDLYHRVAPLLRHRLETSRITVALRARWGIDDLINEVWTVVLEARNEFRDFGPGSFAAWLACLADRTLVNLSRRDQAQKRGGNRDPLPIDLTGDVSRRRFPGESVRPSPSDCAQTNEFLDFASQVLQPRELQAWVWVVFCGYTSEEAALGMATSGAAVRSLLVRSRRRLQEALRAREEPQSTEARSP